jgi:hypothetical protein
MTTVIPNMPIGNELNENSLFVRPIYIVTTEIRVIMAKDNAMALDNRWARQK